MTGVQTCALPIYRNDFWLRRRFEEMGVIQFEDWENTGDEYLKFELGTEAPAVAHPH